jgi:lipopolysaccharide transport system ATP-binding protein
VIAVELRSVSKRFALYRHGLDRLVEILAGWKRHTDFVALHPTDLTIKHGEVIGVIGMNGAGKSTLLKLLAGTLQPSAGSIEVHGRVAALLELGTGFHPEMTGRENVYLSGAVLGLSRTEIDELYEEIVAFSGLRDFMDQPVKTYSSGMFVRLAFSVATSVDPDVLIVDEALSVGDGAFARKSFDRIMGFKKAGKTILFCSHSLYQIEAICSRVIWIHQGRVMMDGDPAQVTAAYNAFLGAQATLEGENKVAAEADLKESDVNLTSSIVHPPQGCARLQNIEVRIGNDSPGTELVVLSAEDDVVIDVRFASDKNLPCPTVGVAIVSQDGRFIASAGTYNDKIVLRRDEAGYSKVTLRFDRLPLLKGRYWINVFLLCENAVHIYDQADAVAELNVVQRQGDLQQGIVALPHRWENFDFLLSQ